MKTLPLIGGVVLLVSAVLAHEKHLLPTPQTPQDTTRAVIEEINQSYVKSVKPIFQKSCFDCHSNQTRFPWYHSIPRIRQLIDSDIREAKKHLNFSNDFPFQGHGSPKEDLEAIEKVVREKAMPPLRYKMMHPTHRLSSTDRQTLFQWISQSFKKLK